MKNIIKKILSFTINYGWILLILIVIGATLFNFVIKDKINLLKINEQNLSESKALYTCKNLDILNNQTLHIYPEIYLVKAKIEKMTGLNVIFIEGGKSSIRSENQSNVACEIPINICTNDYVYCTWITTTIPINYKEWQIWFNKYSVIGGK